jgi:hypothetical protein
MMQKTCEPRLFIARGDFAYTIKRTWHHWRGFLSPRGVLLDLFPSVNCLPSIPLGRRLSAAVVRELRNCPTSRDRASSSCVLRFHDASQRRCTAG